MPAFQAGDWYVTQWAGHGLCSCHGLVLIVHFDSLTQLSKAARSGASRRSVGIAAEGAANQHVGLRQQVEGKIRGSEGAIDEPQTARQQLVAEGSPSKEAVSADLELHEVIQVSSGSLP